MKPNIYTCRHFIWSVLLVLLPGILRAQADEIDSLKIQVEQTSNDTIKLVNAQRLCFLYSEINPDSAIYFAEMGLKLAQLMGFRLDVMYSLGIISYSWLNKGNYSRAVHAIIEAINLGQVQERKIKAVPAHYLAPDDFYNRSLDPQIQRLDILSHLHQFQGILYFNASDFKKSWHHSRYALQLADSTGSLSLASIANFNLARLHLVTGQKDSALIVEKIALSQAMKVNSLRYLGSIHFNLGRIYLALDSLDRAKVHLHQAISESNKQGYYRGVIASYLLLAQPKLSPSADSALVFLQAALHVAKTLNAPELTQRTYQGLVNFYREHYQADSLVKYQALVITQADSINLAKQVQQFQNIDFDEQWRQQSIAEEKTRLRNSQVLILFALVVISLMIIGIILYRSNEHNKQATRQTQQAYRQLEATQSQLIYKEKMASLGELTAGIAHEIQNPLNFVNNFSEINRELIGELKSEISKGNLDEVRAIADDIATNETKIQQHGQRAEGIVKSMLQHSRSGTGQKELTDLNALCDEYLRLAYQGFKTKDSSFSARYEFHPQPDLPKIDVVPQDIGRVVLNLVNNAFYACVEKSKQNIPGYDPAIIVSTKIIKGAVEISIQDNGTGIPDAIKDKIFQPFFTTKPTGQGTGLGLSLAYEIVTKGHGGELKIKSESGKGSEFIIHIPASLTT